MIRIKEASIPPPPIKISMRPPRGEVRTKKARCTMLVTFSLVLQVFSLLSLSFSSAQILTPSSPPSPIQDLLPKFGLPRGLLPDAVASYSITSNGRFQVNLTSPCYVDFKPYLTYYDTSITGVLRYGGIEDLKGIQVRSFLMWFDVEAIKVDLPPLEFVYFEVGWITKKLRVEQFQIVRSCEEKGGFEKLSEPAEEIGLLITE